MDATAAGSSSNNPQDGMAGSSENGGVSLLSNTDPGMHQQKPKPKPKPKKANQKCRFYLTKKGCKTGDACPFSHDFNRELKSNTRGDNGNGLNLEKTSAARAAIPTIPSITPDNGASASVTYSQPELAIYRNTASRAVVRPTSSIEISDPRTFQISQIKRRFAQSLREDKLDNGSTVLHFMVAPSDPDFPFEIEALDCSLRIPLDFPRATAKPSLRIKNKEMERGFQINVERGFENIWAETPNMTLLNAMKLLDKRLESLLVADKAETIKIVPNNSTSKQISSAIPILSANSTEAPPNHLKADLSSKSIGSAPKHTHPEPISSQRRREAAARRETETQTLEHRMGRLVQFSKSSDGTVFTLPIEPRKRNQLPLSLQSIKTFRLFVPASYDIDPCTIQLDGVTGNDEYVKNVEAAFLKTVKERKALNLLTHVNTLAQNMHTMATESLEISKSAEPKLEDASVQEPRQPQSVESLAPATPSDARQERGHVQFISRPTEWMIGNMVDDDDDEATESSFSSSSDDDYISDKSATEQADKGDTGTSAQRERGIMISFPHLEFYGIELLELETLNMTIKCERCKEVMDVKGVRNNERGDYSGMRSETCRKCAFALGVGYRKDLMHASSIRAGYLDLDGCTVMDMLPSKFIPTCGDCSTPYPAPGVVSVRGETSMAICRECHRKLTFRLPEIKFLDVGSRSAFATAAAALPRKKKQKENLGIVAGQELPRRGRCSHYAKSQRWFRFSCCAKVYPCDKCHDEANDHPNEFANRMICGYCSREQNYRPETCGICQAVLTGKRGGGFWEGGKGTRDRTKMSRKDPKKYKKRHATTSASTTKDKEKGKKA